MEPNFNLSSQRSNKENIEPVAELSERVILNYDTIPLGCLRLPIAWWSFSAIKWQPVQEKILS
jgi:hypothetical protein